MSVRPGEFPPQVVTLNRRTQIVNVPRRPRAGQSTLLRLLAPPEKGNQ